MSAVQVDRSMLPLLFITIDGETDWDDVDRLCDAFGNEIDEGKQFHAIVEFRKYTRNAEHSAKVGRWTRDHAEELRKYCECCAIVNPDSIFNVVLKAFLYITPFPYPYTLVKTVEEARSWIRATRTLGREGAAVGA